MAENSVEERMLELIEEICDDEIIREERDVDLFEEGLLDSMAAIELLVAIETEFGVTIAPTAVEREEMNSVNKIIYQVRIRYDAQERSLEACLDPSAGMMLISAQVRR